MTNSKNEFNSTNLTTQFIIKDKDTKILCKQDLLMYSLTDFFTIEENLNKFIPIINGNSKISLRIIDWFVTNYAKKYNVSYYLNIDKYIKQFIVYLNYKSQLKAYSKKTFDPFCRRERIAFCYNDNEELITTVGQLNFFRWAIENKVLDFIEDKLKDIEEDMNKSVRNIYSKKKTINIGMTKRKKRRELSKSATKTVNKHDVKVIVKFD